MKRFITASVNNNLYDFNDAEYVQILLDNWADMSTAEIHHDKFAVAYCRHIENVIKNDMSDIINEYGWNNVSSDISKYNGNSLQFLVRGSVATTSKVLLENMCDAIEYTLESKTPFNEQITCSYYRDYDRLDNRVVYFVVVSGVAETEDDRWW